MSKIDKKLIKQLIKEIIAEEDELILNQKQRARINQLKKYDKEEQDKIENNFIQAKNELVNMFLNMNFLDLKNESFNGDEVFNDIESDYEKVKKLKENNYKEEEHIYSNDFLVYYFWLNHREFIEGIRDLSVEYEKMLRGFIEN